MGAIIDFCNFFLITMMCHGSNWQFSENEIYVLIKGLLKITAQQFSVNLLDTLS